jgi:[ribosomal protein S5]-alanine N-acetyltransferase
MRAPILETQRLILKPLSLVHHSQDYVDWLNDVDIYRYLETGGNYTLEMLKEYILDVEKKDIYFWGIHLKENNLHIGNIKIDPLNTRHGLVEYGILMGCKNEWGKGYAKEATLCIIDFAFSVLKVRKITLGVVEDNTSALNLYQKLGFKTEGVYKNHGFYQGKYCNIIRMALFNPNIKLSGQ